MRHIIISLFLFTSSACLFAQASDFNVVWGEPYKVSNNSFVQKLIPISSGELYAIRLRPGKSRTTAPRVYLEKFDKKLSLRNAQEIKLKFKKSPLNYVDVLMIKGRIYLLSSYFNQSKKTNFLFVQEIKENSLSELKMIASMPSHSMLESGTFRIHPSTDSSHILIEAQAAERGKDPEKLAAFVFDGQFNLIWNKTLDIPYTAKEFSVEEIRVDNNGDLYMLGVVYEDGSKLRRQGKPTYKYLMTAYTENGERSTDFPISLNDKFITDLTFRLRNNNQIICAGFYSEQNSYSLRGSCYLRLNSKTGETEEAAISAFDLDLLTKHLSQNKKQKAKEAARAEDSKDIPELYSYNLSDLILRSDGGAVLIAEQYYVDEQTYRNFNGPGFGFGGWYNPAFNRLETDYYYNFNDIAIANINPNGQLEWSARIPKRQESINDNGWYSSFVKATAASSILFIYNDHPANGLNDDEKRKAFDGYRAAPVIASIDKNGNVRYFRPTYDNPTGLPIVPRMSKQISKNEVLMYAVDGKQAAFGVLKL